MSKRKITEDSRPAYIRLLEQNENFITDGVDQETVLCGELVDAHLLSGGVARGGEGTIVASSATGITVEGRMFLQRLRDEEKQSSIMYKALKYLPILAGYIAGLLSPLLTEWIKSLIK